MTRPGIRINGVLPTSVLPDSQHFGSSDRPLRRWPIRDLGLSRLAIEVDGDRLTVKRTPRLDIGTVDRHRVAREHIARDRRSSELVGEPRRIVAALSKLEHSTELREKSLRPRVGLLRIPRPDPERASLSISQRVDRPGHLDQVCLVMAVHRVHLECHQEPQQAQVAGPTNV